MTRIITGDSRAVLATLPAGSVQCCVTSPPYYGLRDYGMPGQIGLEQTPAEYVAEMVALFRDVRRVLADDGTLWLNIGDTTRNKHLQMIPARVALALQADGWWLRSDIIWHKPNPMPESTKDRPTSAHEHVFLLTKRASYYYDADAIREAWTDNRAGASGAKSSKFAADGAMRSDGGVTQAPTTSGRNARNVWTITPKPFKGAHFATMPPDLVERCILAGTSAAGQCPKCRTPWARVVEKGEPNLEAQRACGGDAAGEYAGQSTKGHDAAGVQNASDVKRRILAGMMHKRTTGWVQTCDCPAHTPAPQTVLDPFSGAGTTALVAQRTGRHSVGIELNPEYVAIATARVSADFADMLA